MDRLILRSKFCLIVFSGWRHNPATQDGLSASDGAAGLPWSSLGRHQCRRYLNTTAPQTHPNVHQSHCQRAYRHRCVSSLSLFFELFHRHLYSQVKVVNDRVSMHVLHNNLWKYNRRHNFSLSTKTDDRNFIIRQLFLYSYWCVVAMTIVLLYLTF